MCTNIVNVIAKFLYDHIFIWFGYPLTIITKQGTQFIINSSLSNWSFYIETYQVYCLLFTQEWTS